MDAHWLDFKDIKELDTIRKTYISESIAMDLRQLRYFTAIIEHGSISKAANHLNIAQPALSQHIRHMEADLGTQLLHRGSRGVKPTEAGEKLLHHARTIIRQFEHAREDIIRDNEEPSGTVCFAMPGTVSQALSVPLIEAVRERYPRIHLRISEAMSGFVLDWLRDGAVDLGILYRAGAIRGLTTEHILSEELFLIGAPSPELGKAGVETEECRIGFAQAAALDLILPGPAHSLRQQLDEVASAKGCTLNITVEIDAFAQIKTLVEHGLGYTILPRVAARRELDAGKLDAWRIGGREMIRTVYFAHVSERPMTLATAKVAETCRAILGEQVRAGDWPATLPAPASIAGA